MSTLKQTDPLPSAAPSDTVDTRFPDHLSSMAAAFRVSPMRGILLWLTAAVFVVIVATSYGQIILNRWNQPFYDALQQRNLPQLIAQLIVFAQIAAGLLVLNVLQVWLNQMLHLRLREALTRDLIGEWLLPKRAFRVAQTGPIGINPDQRLHEDTHRLSDLSVDLGLGLLQAGILLLSFVGVLWSLSEGFVFDVWGSHFQIPGYMVWAALLYSGTASWLSWIIGRPLIVFNANRYAREADLRYALVRVNQKLEAISLAAGEAQEKHRLERDLANLIAATRRIVYATTRVTWVTAGYGWITIVAPIIIAAPMYFGGHLTFGGLMMAVGAFNQFHASLRWFVDNVGSIADWRATLMRVASFRIALLRSDTTAVPERQIDVTTSAGPVLTLDELEIDSHSGATRLSEPHVAIHGGDRILVAGATGAGKTLLTRAIAGLWLSGKGRIGLPDDEITFVVRGPYLPPGTLREALCYPRKVDSYADEVIVAALKRAGLGKLVPMLGAQFRWNQILGDDERRMLSLAQLLLHRPKWIVIDDINDFAEGEAFEITRSIFQSELGHAAIIAFGTADRLQNIFTRTLTLELASRP